MVFFFAIGNVIDVPLLFFFRGRFLDLDSAWTMKVSWELGVFAIRDVINVPFFFFFFLVCLFFLFFFFFLWDAFWTWISAWTMKVSWELGFFTLGTSLIFLFFFFSLGDAF